MKYFRTCQCTILQLTSISFMTYRESHYIKAMIKTLNNESDNVQSITLHFWQLKQITVVITFYFYFQSVKICDTKFLETFFG